MVTRIQSEIAMSSVDQSVDSIVSHPFYAWENFVKSEAILNDLTLNSLTNLILRRQLMDKVLWSNVGQKNNANATF